MREESADRSARGVYGISVAAELTGIDPQTLRLYERRGLLTPSRTDGGTRRYSDDDVVRLERISLLVEEGVNLAGVAQILALEHRNSLLENDNGYLRSENTRLREQTRNTRNRQG
ncbi:MerR family transcriptional regulator [Mycolicibacterium gadium]|uniref:MerR family transcriptional regulator n=1 Tax=Mycolicibacterium gadium TaxID=1794 RepID=A0ABT6GY38_MYCGU|nr:MerR family transcriptional regulator [Mycolicibacterium gadium]MDG5486074.1 MerR family transcriptional regulator [Mycolicibacterium gadium]